MNAEIYDILFRSRKTLLSILESKGYNIEPYEKFGPDEISAMIISEKKNALRMDLTRTKDDPIKQCVVLYRLNRLKQSIAKFMTGLSDPEDENYIKEPSSTEVYVILLEPVNTNNMDVFHNAALNALSNQIHIAFFQAQSLVNDPRKHVLVPPHSIVPKEDIPALKKKYNLQTVANLPLIRFHQDIQVRLLGAVPGNVIKIDRPSPSAGIETVYKYCVP